MKFSYPIIALSMIVLIATRLHHLLYNPTLTEAQAFLHYWPLWVLVAACLVVGYRINKLEGE